MGDKIIFPGTLLVASGLLMSGLAAYGDPAQPEIVEEISFVPEILSNASLVVPSPALRIFSAPSTKTIAAAAPFRASPPRKINAAHHSHLFLGAPARRLIKLPTSEPDAGAFNAMMQSAAISDGENEHATAAVRFDNPARNPQLDFLPPVMGQDSPSSKGPPGFSAGHGSPSATAARMKLKASGDGSYKYVTDPRDRFPEAKKAARKRSSDSELLLLSAELDVPNDDWIYSFYSIRNQLKIEVPVGQSGAALPNRIRETQNYISSQKGIDLESLIPINRIVDYRSSRWEDPPVKVKVSQIFATYIEYEFELRGKSYSIDTQNAESFVDVAQVEELDLRELRRKLTNSGVAVKEAWIQADGIAVSLDGEKAKDVTKLFLSEDPRWKLLLDRGKIILNSASSPKREPVKGGELLAPRWTEKNQKEFIEQYGPAIKASAPQKIVGSEFASKIYGIPLPGGLSLVIWIADGASPREVQEIVESQVPAVKSTKRRPIIYLTRKFSKTS